MKTPASKSAVITALIFGVGALAGAAVFVQGLRMQAADPAWAKTLMTWGGIATVLLAIPLVLPARIRLNLSGTLIVVGLCTFAFNVFLSYRPPPQNEKSRVLGDKRRATPGYDHRTQRQVIADLREKGVDAVPALYGLHRLEDDAPPADLLPLGGVATATAVGCNETGKYMIYPADAQGFNNPDVPEQVDVVIVGDSYAEGHCVAPGDDLAGQLRSRGYRVYSLGRGGNGPLLNLATLVEYGLRMKPKVVVWGWAGNDPLDLRNEQLDPILRRYLDEADFSQNLVARQDEIDAYWRDLIDRKGLLKPKPEPKAEAAKDWEAPPPTLRELLTLYHLRGLLGLERSKKGDWESVFHRVLVTAKARVEAQGAKLYVLPFPYIEFVRARPSEPRPVFGLAAKAGADTINVDPAFYAHEDYESLFPLRMSGHFDPSGYRLVADHVERIALAPNGVKPATTTATTAAVDDPRP